MEKEDAVLHIRATGYENSLLPRALCGKVVRYTETVRDSCPEDACCPHCVATYDAIKQLEVR